MTEIKDLAIEVLKAEGRRWIFYPGERDVNGVRADVAFKNHPAGNFENELEITR